MASKLSRQQAREAVADVVGAAPVPLRWYGSWARGDFHFDESVQDTYSDLDLNGEETDAGRWKEVAAVLREYLSPRLQMRVSIRRADIHDRLTLATSHWLSLTTYLSCLRGNTGNTAQKRAYLAAKTLLLLNRVEVAESIPAVVARNGSDAAEVAFATKTGKLRFDEFPSRHVSGLLASVPDAMATMFEAIRNQPERHTTIIPALHRRISTGELDADTCGYVLAGMRHGK